MLGMNKFHIMAGYFVIVIFVMAWPASAALVPCTDGLKCTVDDFFQLLLNIYNYLLGIAGLVGLLMLVWAGTRMFYFTFLDDSEHELSAAKSTIKQVVFGLIVAAGAYVIVNTLVIILTGEQWDLNCFLSLFIPGRGCGGFE